MVIMNDTLTSSDTVELNNLSSGPEFLKNASNEEEARRDSIYVVLPITIIYIAIFFTGLIGNVSTCVVISRNKSMHTATNYYLFSLAVSDLLLLISGLPPEMYYIWNHYPYAFGEIFCVVQSFAAEISANATVLTITAFTVERYVAICHPFISHTMSKLSRAVKFVIGIWILALFLAIPQAIQYGIVYNISANGTVLDEMTSCSVKRKLLEHAFEISTMLLFVVPMTVITVLYILIGVKLRRSRLISSVKRTPFIGSLNHCDSGRKKNNSQRNVIRMLVAVVAAFFICWAPFHAQRLLAVYAKGKEYPHPILITVYTTLTYVSGIFYYLSTTVNPLLYNIMSNKFREAFKAMLSKHCGRGLEKASPLRPTYSSLSRYPRSAMHHVDSHKSPSVSVSYDNQRLSNNGQQQSSSEASSEKNEKKSQGTGDSKTNGSHPGNSRNNSMGSLTSSQVTVMTNLGKNFNEGNNNSEITYVEDRIQPRALKAVTLGILAERLKFGTKGLFANQPILAKPKVKPEVASAIPKFNSHPSIDSANTISNSSLQDFDETEFTGTELARYMRELNFDLVT